MFLTLDRGHFVTWAERGPPPRVYLAPGWTELEGVTARNVVAYAILLAALALVVTWGVWKGRARHRHRARDDRIDLFHDE
jgi:hypothetical protein